MARAAPGSNKPQGELAAVDKHVRQSNSLSQVSECEVCVPFSSLFSERTVNGSYQRNLAASTGTTGGYLVGHEIRDSEAILRNTLVLGRAGASIWSGLSSTVSMPRQLTANSSLTSQKATTGTSTDQAFGQLALSPKRFSGTASFSKQLWRQAPDVFSEQIDSFGRDALAEMEKVALQGVGGVQPVGVLNTQGVNQITISGASTLATLTNYEQVLAQGNVDLTRLVFLADPLTLNKYRQVTRSTNASKYLIDDGAFYTGSTSILGYPCYVTQNVPASSLFAGDFSKLILGFWGTTDDPPVMLTIDIFSQKRSEQVEITLDMRQDVLCRTPSAFAVNSGSTTQ